MDVNNLSKTSRSLLNKFKKGGGCNDQKFFSALLVGVFLISVIGCASIVSGRMQQLPVFSHPSEAIATVGNMQQETPATFNLDRRMGVIKLKLKRTDMNLLL